MARQKTPEAILMKMVIVMRTDLNMRKGKMVAQGAHAAVSCVKQTLDNPVMGHDGRLKRLNKWWDEGQKKVCVGTNSLGELMVLKDKALDAGLNVSLIIDRGDTEFHGVQTVTCIAIGPDEDEKIDVITGHLKLL